MCNRENRNTQETELCGKWNEMKGRLSGMEWSWKHGVPPKNLPPVSVESSNQKCMLQTRSFEDSLRAGRATPELIVSWNLLLTADGNESLSPTQKKVIDDVKKVLSHYAENRMQKFGLNQISFEN